MRALIVGVLMFGAACADTQIDAEPCSDARPCEADKYCHQGYCLEAGDSCTVDGVQLASEACDDGNDNDNDACTNACEIAVCGDGILRTDLAVHEEGYEQCEAGMDDGVAYCAANCRWEQRPSRLVTAQGLVCLVREGDVVCWGDPFSGLPHAPESRQFVEGVSPIDRIGIMMVPYSGPSRQADHPFLTVDLLPSGRRFMSWSVEWPESVIGYADAIAMYDTANSMERTVATDQRGTYRLLSDDDRASCWITAGGRLHCNANGGDCRSRPNLDIDRSFMADAETHVDLGRLGQLADVALARSATCAVTADGGVLCWGDLRDWGAQGPERCNEAMCRLWPGANEHLPIPEFCDRAEVGTAGDHESETAMEGLADIIDVDAGEYAFLALDRSGAVYEWGMHWELQAALEGVVVRRFPEPALEIAAARQTRCVRLRSGVVQCWGKHSGQGPSEQPVAVAIPEATGLSHGWSDDVVCASVVGGDVYCWGDNASGQLGTPNAPASATPVRIELPN